MRIDSHQHFWKYHPIKDAWITDEMKVIQRDFMPADLLPLLQANYFDGVILVQADQSEEETNFLLELAVANDFIKGVVGWIDLCAENISDRLSHYAACKKLKGFRHIVQAEPADDFLLRSNFCSGISQLANYHFTYDLLILPRHLPFAKALVEKFPSQPFVIDHLAKPNFKRADYKDWEKGIRAIARHQNVYCKVSGLVTEADWKNWRVQDFTYCLDVVTASFGVNRLMFGSDWPVCLLGGSYADVNSIVEQYFAGHSLEDQAKIFGLNAIQFYNI
ncbi:MAG TPA: amidohydrolase family protein [Sediminibacterium sp.]|uniref:amidohydrolase family protein n=1 Tax=Sediminibacterium sp. TaxID=1917865 RepID=UPI0008C60D21|nr:amidohydrolase family protein [Sediminibacterium sp.]OHC85267.1 MAG: amidohydrolase [Sphingobacteriia bacterium RIFOXYC2_FULL_35_18]OHC89170.1 MAG: amidohydrolase [Sphingobacteriia bacterium RIFOXYD2_FULL_35_12]HLD53548.1 amidohydrolase family protein [Sediminibacterium sp.]